MVEKRRYRQGYEKRILKSATTLPLISCGKTERDILKYLKKIKSKQRFSINGYAKKIAYRPRSTIQSALQRLLIKGLVAKDSLNNYLISSKGIKYLDRIGADFTPAEKSRKVCRKGELNTHKFEYVADIVTRPQNLTLKGFKLEINDKLKNHKQYYYYSDELLIRLTPKKVYFYIKEIFENNTDRANIESFNILVRAIKLLASQDLIIKELRLFDEMHFSRIKSYFSSFLSKIDEKYQIDLGNDVKFWIDLSHNLEDETNKEEFRDRLDSFMVDMANCTANLSDIEKVQSDLDKLIEITTNLTRISSNLVINEFKEPPRKRPNYVG